MSKYVVVSVDNKDYGISIDQVNSIEKPVDVVDLPNSDIYMKGYSQYRDIVTPVIDLKALMHNLPITINDESRFLYLNLEGGKHLGVVVEEAKEIIEIADNEIKNLNEVSLEDEPYMKIAYVEDRLIILINVLEALDSLNKLNKI